MMKLVCALLATSLLVACTQDKKDSASGQNNATKAAATPHGGKIVEVGDHVAHLELKHDEKAGTITVYVLGKDEKTPFPLTKAPEVKLRTQDGPKVLATKAQDDKNTIFSVTDDALKVHGPQGRISLEINGKPYNPGLPHMDDH